MAVKCGFFDAVDSDRAYSADQISEYFDGLVSNGVYEDVGGALQVIASGGMSVSVRTGRAIINCKWVTLDAAETVTITAAHATLPRYSAVVLRLDYDARDIVLTTKDGTPASAPAKPTISPNELCLAYVYVDKGVNAITQANITDTRPSDVCGWVTGLIKQVNTSELFLQWQTAYEEFYASFQSWFDTLTNQLQVNTYLTKFEKLAKSGSSFAPVIDVNLDMEGYTYEETDIIEVYLNGLAAVEGEDYTVDASSTPAKVHVNAWEGQTPVWDYQKQEWDVNTTFIRVIKSKIGDPVPAGGGSHFSLLTITETQASTNAIDAHVVVE